MLLSLIVSGIVCASIVVVGVVGYLLDKTAERHDRQQKQEQSRQPLGR